MTIGRKIGIYSLIVWIITHFMSREYCLCCVRSCGILTQNIWDYLYIVSILGCIISIIFIIDVKIFEKKPTKIEGEKE